MAARRGAQAGTDAFEFAREEPARAPAAQAVAYAEVALNKPLPREYTYAVRAEHAARARPGARVVVPFGSRRELGVVVALRADTDLDPRRVRAVLDAPDAEPLLDEAALKLARWMSGYYACSLGEALAAFLPAALKREGEARKTKLVRATCDRAQLAAIETSHPRHHRLLRLLLEVGDALEAREACRRANVSPAFAKTLVDKGLCAFEHVAVEVDMLQTASVERRRPDRLSDDQSRALEAIELALRERRFQPFLLQGVTGSGKTEVYLRAIESALAMGRGAIAIVPEIALTPQTVGWFRARFGEVAVLHSGMTEAQRRDMWLRVKQGRARVVVGARSAVFAPVAELGVVVVDEEHEPSYKQGETPRYHARDVAVVRARDAGAACILGSATPALETWHNAREGRYALLKLSTRPGGARLPQVEVVDLRNEARVDGRPALFSSKLAFALKQALADREQSILFINRRGWSPTLWCQACGETLRCRQCDSALVLHRRIGRVVCHSCCEEIAPPSACPSCTAPKLRIFGAGAERVEGELQLLLPEARVARMDSDTMVRREDYERVLDRFGRREIDVLVGTQMIAKGLDFPLVTLVGVLDADAALHMPDFRAAERTFQLLAQVAGRAGRGDRPGRIVVQTSMPEAPVIRAAARHDYEGFAVLESKLREELGYPPHGKLVRVVFEDEDAQVARQGAMECCAALVRAAAGERGLVVLGPNEAPIALVRGRHRQHLLVKARGAGEGLARVRAALRAWIADHARPRAVVDVDPVSML
jgi:primosomal protein N' (replication factor Y)